MGKTTSYTGPLFQAQTRRGSHPFHSIGDVQRRHIRTRFDFVMIFSRLIYSRFNKAIINLRSIIIENLLMAYRAGKESIT